MYNRHFLYLLNWATAIFLNILLFSLKYPNFDEPLKSKMHRVEYLQHLHVPSPFQEEEKYEGVLKYSLQPDRMSGMKKKPEFSHRITKDKGMSPCFHVHYTNHLNEKGNRMKYQNAPVKI